jgi:hypothetical protein
MSSLFTTKSTFMGLLTRGMFWSIITPWKAEIDMNRKRVTILKRNWYLINVDEETFQFSSVRHITIDKFLFGADIHIRMYSGNASIYAISKKSAKQIKELLLN